MSDYAQARSNMVEGQLRTNKVSDPAVIRAFLSVKREDFVPAAFKGAAYIDEDLPIGQSRYLIEPMVLARLVQFAEINPTDRVLDIAGATGYSAAILAQLAGAVVALESEPSLAARAAQTLASVTNVTPVAGPLEAGWPEGAPYDVIVINGTVEHLPAALTAQLAEGGRLVAVMRSVAGAQPEAVMYERVGNSFSHRPLFDASVPDLASFRRAPTFAF